MKWQYEQRKGEFSIKTNLYARKVCIPKLNDHVSFLGSFCSPPNTIINAPI